MGNGNSTPNCKQQEKRKTRLASTDEYSGRNKVHKIGRGGRTTNPFIVFFLRLRSKKPSKPVTEIARLAGKIWSRMSVEERKKYIDLANAEKKRREQKRRKRKCSRRK
ncbi:protamine-like isoform X1 [Cephus cinctus]|uniref:Protamine-like isoform X1 n=1 Tax=Cephus cinctus TaxID=211228 RepID=A0AAJ7BHS9_CEPCN|nr:protamine-like isoform X1 [Cephus cinctus]